MRYVLQAAFSALYFLLMAATFNSLGQVLPFIVADLHFSWAQAGMGFTLLGTACGAASLLPAATIRRWGVAVTLVLGAVQLIAGFTALAMMQGVGAYVVGTFLLGMGFCFCGTIPAVHVIGHAFERRRATAIGLYFTAGNLGAVFGPLLFYGVHTATGDWRLYWLLCAGAALVVGGFAALVSRRDEVLRGRAALSDEEASPAAGWTVRRAMTTWQFWMVVAAYTGCLLINTTIHSFAYQHLLERAVSPGMATMVISAAAMVAAGAAALAGLAGQRFDPRQLTIVALVTLALSSAALVLPTNWASLTLFALCFGVGLGASTVSTTLLLREWFGGLASLELYSVMTVVSTAAALGPSVGGRLYDTIGSFAPSLLGQAGVAAVLAMGVAMMRQPGARPEAVGAGVGAIEEAT
ncbi:MFS transporter [Novosphingobium sp. KCTC 2891]|uniref:MFS transporter n=1 Tax=Novosphingobium sp. KCTC 2891 TaxID=2989730 RepID=UPI0022218042|nr:MFS transporter [Novosphingobium sp. KCTC 2891]MCW1383731.1 MFS transporter [Novosphingobium sp. KCTC 2891]